MQLARTAASLTAVAAAAALGVTLLGSSPAAPVSVGAQAVVAPEPGVAALIVHAPQVVRVPRTAAVTHRTTHHVTRHVTHAVSTHRAAAVVRKPTAVTPAAKPAVAKPVRTSNDYPYAGATTNANDAWGFTERQCVSFAAFRLSQEGHALDNSTQSWGSAFHWDDAAAAHGASLSSTPRVGAIAQWNVGETSKVWIGGRQGSFAAGDYGHVGYVAAVYADGSALIEQYNATGDRAYSTMRMTAPRYLVF